MQNNLLKSQSSYQFIYQCRIDGTLCSIPCSGYEACNRFAHLDCANYETFECLVLIGEQPNTFIHCDIMKNSAYTDEDTGCSYIQYEIKPQHTYKSLFYYVSEH